MNPIDSKRLLREVSILRQMPRHPNIVKLFDIFTDENTFGESNTLYFVFDVARQDLLSFIKKNAVIEVLNAKRIMYSVLCGLKFLHSAGIVHRDLKPANILIDMNGQAQICDFGLARTTAGILDPGQIFG